MATVYINDQPVDIGEDRLNLIQAAQRVGVEIPHYCWHPELTVVASCRMCLVEVGEKKEDGTIAMIPKVVPGCQTPAKHNTVVVTNSEKVKAAQAGTLEYILLNHPLDCPVCDQAGECFLQDYSYRYGRSYSRLQDDKLIRADKDHIGDQIALFTDRCVMCSRCVRFTREVSGTSELQIINRGDHAEIDVFPGQPCNNKLAGNVVDICPVGALCSKDFLYKQRVWFLKSQKSVCPGCSTGCSISVDQNKNIVYRLKPRENPLAQGHFMCDEGRFGFKYINRDGRLTSPMVRHEGNVIHSDWDAVLPTVQREFTEAVKTAPSKSVMVISPWATCEEAYLFSKYAQGLASDIRLALGPVPVVGEDDTYPKDAKGKPVEPVRFTIRAEKCPNRAGVESVLTHFSDDVSTFDEVLSSVEGGEIDYLYIVGGYPQIWLRREEGDVLGKAKLLIVQDLMPTPASDVARYFLPGGSFAEKDGTFINHAGLAQAIHRAILPPGDARPDGRIAMELMQRPGLFHAPTIRAEMVGEIDAFAALREADLGEYGVACS